MFKYLALSFCAAALCAWDISHTGNFALGKFYVSQFEKSDDVDDKFLERIFANHYTCYDLNDVVCRALRYGMPDGFQEPKLFGALDVRFHDRSGSGMHRHFKFDVMLRNNDGEYNFSQIMRYSSKFRDEFVKNGYDMFVCCIDEQRRQQEQKQEYRHDSD